MYVRSWLARAAVATGLAAGAAPAAAQEALDVPPSITFVTTGGAWRYDSLVGTYRVVVSTYGWNDPRSRVYLQWLLSAPPGSGGAPGGPRLLAATPINELDLSGVWTVGQPALEPDDDRTRLRLRLLDSRNGAVRECDVTLGPPGRYQWHCPAVGGVGS